MPVRIRINVKDVLLDAELFDTAAARAVADALPIEAQPSEWGDEFYFGIPLKLPPDETATTKVAVGDIGYWPPGNALAIFFGPTPMSTGPEPVPASEVNIVGRITGMRHSSERQKAPGRSGSRGAESSSHRGRLYPIREG